MLNILTVERLNADQLLRMLPAQTVQQGRQLYEQGRVTIETHSPQAARLRVVDKPGTDYQVTIWLHPSQILLACTCPQGHQWGTCRHRVAGVLQLHKYLTENPPQIWKAVLDQSGQAQPRRQAAALGPIVFSMQYRNTSWIIAPYVLAQKHFTEQTLHGGNDAIAQVIDQTGLSSEARLLRSRISQIAYPNVSAAAIAVANLIATSGTYGYGYTYGMSTYYEPAFMFLPDCLVYVGDEEDPLQKRIVVLAEPGSFELNLDSTPAGLRLTAQVAAGERILPIKSGEYQIIIPEPLWLLIDTIVVRLPATDNLTTMLLSQNELLIPSRDQDEFLERYLLPLAERVPVRGDLLEWEDIIADPVPRLYLSEVSGELRAELRFGYAEYELPYDKRLPASGTRRKPHTMILAHIHRKPEFEQQALQGLNSHGLKRGTEPGIMLLRKGGDPVDFLLHRVPKLAQDGYEVYGEEALTSARVNRNRPTISFNVTSGIDWFDVQADVNFGDLVVSTKDIRQAIRRRERYVKLADGSIGALPEEWLARYRHLFALAEETTDGLRLSQGHVSLLDDLLADADRAQSDPEYQRRREQLRSFQSIQPVSLPQVFHGELRSYQKSGYDWLHFLHDYGFGGCLADDMGTGKTITALAFIQSLREREPDSAATLIVVPRSLVYNWEREAQRFTPNLRIYIHTDQDRMRDTEKLGDFDIVLTTYGILLRDIEFLREYQFHYVILDESQAIKNPLAETSKAARLLRGEHRLVLTGTPVENTTMELWSQFAFLNPGLLGNLDYFREEFATPIERKQDAEAARFLRKMVYPFILRRTKDQVAPELPPRTERVIVGDMEPAQRRLYNKQRDYYRALLLKLIETEGMQDARMKVLEGLLRLRQICNHPRLVDPNFKGTSGKFELLIETLETLQSEGHRALIFSQFVQMLSLVREALDARKIAYTYLDGQTRDRQAVVDRFQGDESIPFFLISLKAGGVGLNLTAADYVIHIDPWWNPAVEMQASDRAHRIGQEKPVFVYKLVARDSVEEKILQLQNRKRELVEQLISAEGGVFKALTRDDVEVLFS